MKEPSSAKSDFKKKQTEIDLQHKVTVAQIKSDIWQDRETFLKQIIQLEENHQKELQTKQSLVQQQSVTQKPKAVFEAPEKK